MTTDEHRERLEAALREKWPGKGYETMRSQILDVVQAALAASPTEKPAGPNDLQRYRDSVKAELRRRGFVPAEEADWRIGREPNCLQWEWRKEGCRRDPAEIMLAILDGLTQEGVAAWPGDATSIVEQIVRVQYNRAERALAGAAQECEPECDCLDRADGIGPMHGVHDEQCPCHPKNKLAMKPSGESGTSAPVPPELKVNPYCHLCFGTGYYQTDGQICPCTEVVGEKIAQAIWLLECRAADRHKRPRPTVIQALANETCNLCGHVGCEGNCKLATGNSESGAQMGAATPADFS